MMQGPRSFFGWRIKRPAHARMCAFLLRATSLACMASCYFFLMCAPLARAQSTSATTWTVSIVLPPRLVAGQPATLAVLGVDGRLAEGITVDLGKGQRVKTDKTGRAFFTVPTDAPLLIATAAGDSSAALIDA